MPTQVLLIRHGETPWNREQRIQGHTDVPLSPLGEEQARRLALRLQDLPVSAAVSSDSSRALRTGEIALAGRHLHVETATALRERDFGAWEGQKWTDIFRDHPADAEHFQKDPVGFAPPQGESWNQMQQRVFEEIKKQVARHPGAMIAVFTHGGPCKAAVFAALGVPPSQWRSWVTGNASLQRLIWDDSLRAKGRIPWVLAGFNDVAHLGENDLLTDPSALTTEGKAV